MSRSYRVVCLWWINVFHSLPVWDVQYCVLLRLQGVHLDDCTSLATHCECSDTDPVCPRCGGSRRSRDSVGVASLDAATAGQHETHSSLGDTDVFESPPASATIPDDLDIDRDDAGCLQRLYSASEITPANHHQHHHQQRSYSAVTDSFSVLPDSPTDVGGVSVRSAPDSAVPIRQPEVVPGGQRSKFQRFFEPLKRSKSAGNQKDVSTATQATLYNPTRQSIPV